MPTPPSSPQILLKLLLWNALGNMPTFQEHFATIIVVNKCKIWGANRVNYGQWENRVYNVVKLLVSRWHATWKNFSSGEVTTWHVLETTKCCAQTHCSCSIVKLRLHVSFCLWVVFVSRQSTVLNAWFFAYIGALISMTTSQWVHWLVFLHIHCVPVDCWFLVDSGSVYVHLAPVVQRPDN